MSGDGPSLESLLAQLDRKQIEIGDLAAQIQAMVKSQVDRSKLHAKRIIKQGMEAFFAGNRTNPHPTGSEDAELWDYGYQLSKDNWDDIRK